MNIQFKIVKKKKKNLSPTRVTKLSGKQARAKSAYQRHEASDTNEKFQECQYT